MTWDLELRKNCHRRYKGAIDDVDLRPLAARCYTFGLPNQEQALFDAHVEGDMLGFETVLDDSHGQRLRFFLIGRMTEDKIQGIFLDAWGASGTWTAIPSKPPEPTCAAASPAAEENVIPVPRITQRRQPDYPMLPWEAHIQGQVRLRVSTDSYCVAKVTAESSEPLLAQAAEANVRTWWFDTHKPGTFSVTFNYRLLEPGSSFLEKPGVVEISDLFQSSLGGPRSRSRELGHPQEETWKA